MITCSYCNESKDESQFYRIFKSTAKCKVCHSVYISNYLKSRPEKTAKNREYVRKSKPNRKKVMRAFVNWLKSAPCTDCGKCFHPEVMDFDHTQHGPKGGPREAIANQVARVQSPETLMEKLLTCELVCANCHRIRTVQRRIGTERYLQEITVDR